MVVRGTLRKNVRILLLGDRGVGKTSLILSLVSEEFPEDVPFRAEEITIPPDVTPEMVPTHIVDYSAQDQTEDQLLEEVRRAHVICLVYSVEDERTLLRITTHWLPLLRDAIPHSRCPIILVGNKVDLTDESTVSERLHVIFKAIGQVFYGLSVPGIIENHEDEDTNNSDPGDYYYMFMGQLGVQIFKKIGAAQEIMEEFPEIETFVECSAKSLRNISEMFYYAQKAVLHPTAPIYVAERLDLTEECKKALTRIFMVCDLDNDGLLNDYELNAFQKRCFDMPLRPEAMEDVKEVLKRNNTGGVSPNNCITLQGFLYLHCLFIQRGHSHTTWTVLRKFGYNDQLHLTKDFLFPPVKIPSGSSAELSYKGSQFFTKLFWRFDKDKDGALSPVELTQLFATCSAPAWGSEMKNLVPTNEKDWITLPGFMCFWAYTTVTDVQMTFEYLAYFGYPINECENQLSAIQVTREKKFDILKKHSTRNVYRCHVIGMHGVGKSTISRKILDHSIEVIKEDSRDTPQRSVNVVQVYGQEKYLIMKELEVRNISDPLTSRDVKCDVACLVYDCTNPKSFEYVARIYLKYFEDGRIPVLFVGCKSDLTEVRQDYLVQPTAFCDAHRLAPPHKFSAHCETYRDVYQKLATMAAFPHLTELSLLSGDSLLMKAGIGLAIVAAIGLVVSKLISKHDR